MSAAKNADAVCGLSAAGIGREAKKTSDIKAARPGGGEMRPMKNDRAAKSRREGCIAQKAGCRVEAGSVACDARGTPQSAETAQRGVKTNQENTMKKKNVGSAAIRASREDWDEGHEDVGGVMEAGLDEYYQDEVLVDWDALEEVRALFADRYDGEPEV